jgi:hypothetical protein
MSKYKGRVRYTIDFDFEVSDKDTLYGPKNLEIKEAMYRLMLHWSDRTNTLQSRVTPKLPNLEIVLREEYVDDAP